MVDWQFSLGLPLGPFSAAMALAPSLSSCLWFHLRSLPWVPAAKGSWHLLVWIQLSPVPAVLLWDAETSSWSSETTLMSLHLGSCSLSPPSLGSPCPGVAGTAWCPLPLSQWWPSALGWGRLLALVFPGGAHLSYWDFSLRDWSQGLGNGQHWSARGPALSGVSGAFEAGLLCVTEVSQVV